MVLVDVFHNVTFSFLTHLAYVAVHKHMPRARFQPQRRCATFDTAAVPVQTGCLMTIRTHRVELGEGYKKTKAYPQDVGSEICIKNTVFIDFSIHVYNCFKLP